VRVNLLPVLHSFTFSTVSLLVKIRSIGQSPNKQRKEDKKNERMVGWLKLDIQRKSKRGMRILIRMEEEKTHLEER
jgi:hypothetical protein